MNIRSCILTATLVVAATPLLAMEVESIVEEENNEAYSQAVTYLEILQSIVEDATLSPRSSHNHTAFHIQKALYLGTGVQLEVVKIIHDELLDNEMHDTDIIYNPSPYELTLEQLLELLQNHLHLVWELQNERDENGRSIFDVIGQWRNGQAAQALEEDLL